jgi:hypothetical protein
MLASRPAAAPPSEASYGFYTFYDGLPWLMWSDKKNDSEYERYRDSVARLGTAVENGSSVAVALVRHPAQALLRFALKPIDWIAGLAWVGSLTPLGIVLALFGLRAWRRRGAPLVVPLLAYAGPAAVLLVPLSAPHYFAAVASPLLLAAAAGADELLGRPRWTLSRVWAAHALLATAALIGVFGKADVMNSPVMNATADYLRERCAAGCVSNLLPQSIRGQAWVDLEGPVPAVGLANNDERKIILGGFGGGVPFPDRVRAANAAGWDRPVLYVDVQVATFDVWERTFESGAGDDRPADLFRAVAEREFQAGPDRVVVYALQGAESVTRDVTP